MSPFIKMGKVIVENLFYFVMYVAFVITMVAYNVADVWLYLIFVLLVCCVIVYLSIKKKCKLVFTKRVLRICVVSVFLLIVYLMGISVNLFIFTELI